MADKTLVTIISNYLDSVRLQWRIGQNVVDPVHPATGPHLHLIPVRAVVEHAVEYGVDPADSRTMVDWMLHERFVLHPDPRDTARFCPYRNPPHVAWAAHQDAIAEVKTRVSISDPQGLLEKIHLLHRASDWSERALRAAERVSQTRAYVAHIDRIRHG